LLKWIAIGLLIINVGVFLSLGNQTDPAEKVSIAQPLGVNEQAMLLLDEVENVPSLISAPSATRPASDENADVLGNGNASNVVTRGLSSEPPTSRPSDFAILPVVDDAETQKPERMYKEQQLSTICFRVGPFSSEQSIEQASAWMMENEIAAETITGNSREVKAIRIYAGPFLHEESLDRYVSELKVKQLQFREMNRELEYYVYRDSETGPRISFGYFHQQELANKYLTDLQEIGIQAELELNYETVGPLYWLDAAVPLDFVNQLQSRHWADEKIKSVEIDC